MSAQLNPTPEKNTGMNLPWNEYMVDSFQRTILFWDTMRRRGNQYHESMAKKSPNVLHFDYELIVNGRSLEEPVNYGLARIIPPKDNQIDPDKRPFVVIDPRAGHGPGIGGFKSDSEIGMALRQGHPCYAVGFTPTPEPGQTIDKVIRAMAKFLEKVIELHPENSEKPVIIGNCQAGWAVMMLAALHPDLCGPIIAAGAPLSYWAGVRGTNPMRYGGGMLGGSWLTAMISDLGNGHFNGSWLVHNFENLNPANTLWGKQYNLYANIDTEEERYLEFERWWDAHVLLNAEEIQYIVDNLFIGNRLSVAGIITDDKKRIDLRNINSPIICFCSRGDNITPPQQALDWILDLYDSVEDIQDSGQTIIYAIHDHIGHLGIFVGTGVAQKEHSEFASNIDLIDCMPPGLYEIVIENIGSGTVNLDLVEGDYITRIEKRTLDDIRALGGNNLEEERSFATANRVSQANYGLYRSTLQPMVQALSSETTAEYTHNLHPLRLSYEIFSDHNPLLQKLPQLAETVREKRTPAAADNPFRIGEELFSSWMSYSLNSWRDWRDTMTETTFFATYSQPWLQALAGLKTSDGPPRQHPGLDPGHLAVIKLRKRELLDKITVGSGREAMLRALLYANEADGDAADERKFAMLDRVMQARHFAKLPLAEFKRILREQYFMLLLDPKQALAVIPELLQNHQGSPEKLYEMVEEIIYADGPPPVAGKKRLARLKKLFSAGKEKKIS